VHFKIITSFYNVEEWLKYTIRSMRVQDYKDFQCILTNDMSTDNSLQIARKETEGDPRFLIIDNEEKKNTLHNNVNAINLTSSDEDVIVILDGDDWFSSKGCLGALKKVYEKEKCWMTYGSYMEYPAGSRGKFARKCPQSVVDDNSYRENEWVYSHLKTFKYFLWKRLQEKDFMDPSTGDYFDFAQDLVYMFPLLEMAGPKAKYIEEILYVYNLRNPLNEHKVDHSRQLAVEQIIRNKQKYSLLEERGRC